MTHHICDPQPTELTGFDSAGCLVGHAEYGVFGSPRNYEDEPFDYNMRLRDRWRVAVGKATAYYCHQEQGERWLRDNGAVEIKEGDGRR